MLIKDKKTLKQIYAYVQTLLPDFTETQKSEDSENINFEEWNKQFTDNQNLDDFIPEYGTTLREFRKGIYDAETGSTKSLGEFQKNLKTW